MGLPNTPQRTNINFVISTLKRAIKEEIADRRFTPRQKEQVIQLLQLKNPECAYCGEAKLKAWDHLLPIKNGGDTVFGNLVPVCSSCNSSKKDRNYQDWMFRTAEGSLRTRIGEENLRIHFNRISEYVVQSGYKPTPIQLRFTKRKLKLLDKRQKAIESLLRKLHLFISESKKK